MNRVFHLIEGALRICICIFGLMCLLIGGYSVFDANNVVENTTVFAEDAILGDNANIDALG